MLCFVGAKQFHNRILNFEFSGVLLRSTDTTEVVSFLYYVTLNLFQGLMRC